MTRAVVVAVAVAVAAAVAVSVSGSVSVAVSGSVSVSVSGSVAVAQDVDAGPSDEPRYRVIRPAEGSLRRGSLAVPIWVPIAIGTAVALGAAALLIRRARRSRR